MIYLDSSYNSSYVEFSRGDSASSLGECKLSWVDFYTASYDEDPRTAAIIHWSFTIDGVTYEPSTMSLQDVYNAIGSYYNGYNWDHAQEMNPVEEWGWQFPFVKIVDDGAYQTYSGIYIYPWNDTGAETESANCMPVVTIISLRWNEI